MTGTSTMVEHGCQGRRREKMVGWGMAATMMNVVIVGEKEAVRGRAKCGRSAEMPTRRRQRSPRTRNDKTGSSKLCGCGILRKSGVW